jgi:hypothetical protein
VIIIGKAPNGDLVGVVDPLLDEEKLANALSDNISPAIIPDIEIISFLLL